MVKSIIDVTAGLLRRRASIWEVALFQVTLLLIGASLRRLAVAIYPLL